MMQFAKHETALELQKTLQEVMIQLIDQNVMLLEDITLIYDRPISLCLDVVSLLANHVQEDEVLETLEDIKRKYRKKSRCALTSFEKEDITPLLSCIRSASRRIA